MTPELLLELAQKYKFEQIRRKRKNAVGVNKVTRDDIENMGETLKMIVFFVSPAIIREAIDLAEVRGVLQ
jgi:hypothetical protein